jgi:DNA-binding response OmpR family regulator
MLKVLIIDNDVESRENLRQHLLRLGMEVFIVDTGELAIEEMQKTPFDAVFAPLCLHGFGGRGIARWVKANGMEATRVFIMTSWKGELELDLLRFDGIRGVIRKPFVFSEIRDAVMENPG